MKYKQLKFFIASLAVVLSFGTVTTIVHADEPGFSVTPVLGENQVKPGLGYFSLLLKSGQTQTLKFNVFNNGNTTLKIDTTFGTAFTGEAGNVLYTPTKTKPDPSLKINIKDYVTLPKEVSVPAHSKVTVSAKVTMPKADFKGVIAGGFNFNENESEITNENSSASKSSASITNRYAYVVGLLMQENENKVAPTLTLGKVGASQRNSRNIISANLTNAAMVYLLDMNTNAVVTNIKDSSIKYSFNNTAMEMAPNSNFDLAIPVSIQGALKKDQTSTPLKPGKYHLAMTVYGSKDPSGKYQTMVDGQVTKYDYKWTFDKDFTITGTQAKQLNAKDVTVDHTQKTNWVLYLLIAVILLLVIIIFILLLKRRKKEEDDK